MAPLPALSIGPCPRCTIRFCPIWDCRFPRPAYGFDSGFKIAGDFDFAARLISPSNVARVPVWISGWNLGGLSSNVKHRRVLHEERLRVLRSHILPKAQSLALALADVAEEEFSV